MMLSLFSKKQELASPVLLPYKLSALLLLLLRLRKEEFGPVAFFPSASPSSLGYRSANSCKESRDH